MIRRRADASVLPSRAARQGQSQSLGRWRTGYSNLHCRRSSSDKRKRVAKTILKATTVSKQKPPTRAYDLYRAAIKPRTPLLPGEREWERLQRISKQWKTLPQPLKAVYIGAAAASRNSVRADGAGDDDGGRDLAVPCPGGSRSANTTSKKLEEPRSTQYLREALECARMKTD